MAVVRYLTDSDGVVQHCLCIRSVVTTWELGVAEVCLQQEMSLCVCTVERVGVDLQRELLGQLAVKLVLVVSDRYLGVLLCILKNITNERRKSALVSPNQLQDLVTRKALAVHFTALRPAQKPVCSACV